MKLARTLTYAAMAIAIAASCWMTVRHMGLIDGLDFGCGQYYYTDIPDWQRWFSVEDFRDGLPRWVYYAIFFAWGWAMYRLWAWLDSRPEA